MKILINSGHAKCNQTKREMKLTRRGRIVKTILLAIAWVIIAYLIADSFDYAIEYEYNKAYNTGLNTQIRDLTNNHNLSVMFSV